MKDHVSVLYFSLFMICCNLDHVHAIRFSLSLRFVSLCYTILFDQI